MNFDVACLKIGFKDCTLEICDIFLISKFLFNQKISQDSRNSGKFLWYIISRKSFSNLFKIQKNDKDYQNWQILTN